MKPVENMTSYIKEIGIARVDVKARVKIIAAKLKQIRQVDKAESDRRFGQSLSGNHRSTA